MAISFESHIAIPEDVLVRELDGEAVLLNLNNESYYGLDNVGTRMWALLTTKPTVAEAYAALLVEYEVAPEQLQGDMAFLLAELLDNGLIQVEHAAVA